MKRIIIIAVIAVIAVSISLGFTVIKNTPENVPTVKSERPEKIDFSNKSDEKRLANWD
ncbi:hypothetical protein [Daejeonella sp.]|uniref:hypothetical protein n=1 Tax=Daejeonella sp. TaxID=2805397 RepID=UPI003983409A